MREIIVVCEGQTEEVFVNEVLAPTLWNRNVFLGPRLIATSRHSKGGPLKGQRGDWSSCFTNLESRAGVGGG